MPALRAAGPGEAVREDASVEVAAQSPLGGCWRARPGAILLKRKPGGKMSLHRAIEQGAFGPATAVDGTARRGTGGDTQRQGSRAS